jgi:hypothetical protein
MKLHEVQLKITPLQLATISSDYHFLAKIDPLVFLDLNTYDNYGLDDIVTTAHDTRTYNDMAKNKGFAMPFIRLKGSEKMKPSDEKPSFARIMGHEGRHRASSLLEQNIRQMIVAVQYRSGSKLETQRHIQKYGERRNAYVHNLQWDDIPDKIIGMFRGYLPKKELVFIKNL